MRVNAVSTPSGQPSSPESRRRTTNCLLFDGNGDACFEKIPERLIVNPAHLQASDPKLVA